jgi:general nucleoside transport system permease protein
MKAKHWILIACCLAALLGVMAFGGSSIGEALAKLVTGSLGGGKQLSGTLEKFVPLTFLGVAVFIGLRAGLFNIGANGQFTIGACVGTVVMLKLGGFIGLLAGIPAGALAGALWALPAGWIKAYRNGHEVITTIMLNLIAVNLSSYLASGPIKGKNQSASYTDPIAAAAKLPELKIAGVEISVSVVLAIALVVATSWWLYKTVSGYELRATGANPVAAQFAGIKTKQVTVRAMAISGAIAGLAGVIHVAQFEHQFYPTIAESFGFDAIAVSLLAGNSALALLGTGFFFGALTKGGSALATLGMNKNLTWIITAIIIIIFGALLGRKNEERHG